jgi:AraC-like DNA-binding protein
MAGYLKTDNKKFRKNNNLNMTELSYESDYFDQSHFISDFKSFCGLIPKQYFVGNETLFRFF